jgi:plasmid maintenance system antidote protein VapI
VQLGRHFGNSAQFWLDVQSQRHCRGGADKGSKIAKRVRPVNAA